MKSIALALATVFALSGMAYAADPVKKDTPAATQKAPTTKDKKEAEKAPATKKQ